MLFKRLLGAVMAMGAVASFAFTPTAHAFTGTAVGTVTETDALYIGGATATDPALRNLMLLSGGLCVNNDASLGRDNNPSTTNDIDVYENNSDPDVVGWAELLVTCRHLTSNHLVWMFKFAGGSGTGTTDLATEVVHLAITWPPSGCTDGTYNAGAIPGFANLKFTLHTGCATSNHVLDSGIADVEARLLRPFTDQPKLNQRPLAQVTFAPIVGLKLYRALQKAQGLDDTSDNEANTPSLSWSTLTGIFKGTITNWTQLNNASGTALPSVSGVVTPSSTRLFVCMRNDTSGTQALFRESFTKEKCAPGTSTAGTANTGVIKATGTFNSANSSCQATGCAWSQATFFGSPPNFTSGERVIANTTSTSVFQCVDGINAINAWSMGISSTDQSHTAQASDADDWRYIGIDGKPSTLRYYITGNQRLYSENNFAIIDSAASVTDPNAKVVAGNADATIADEIVAKLGSESVIKAVNAGFFFDQGHFGLLAAPSASLLPNPGTGTEADADLHPTNTTRKSSLTTINNCNDAGAVSNNSKAFLKGQGQ